ncbi:uncharacterized protein F5Z01DRAFT_409288 [Emericellopsis atlantica]|uniref:Uncharacterized protein n=1 Tax=Emericellopsis atlantica TaxID=2614577 RepID=A0A9P8CSY5_9HYPO|nr:uncharacterized protein F5Z01DRAFT_409288 [Emericellopsis atlantica]KAG9257670.1 hypothetical protein F5Z01DRAFT_409288 [Emericellopsis atlantica]
MPKTRLMRALVRITTRRLTLAFTLLSLAAIAFIVTLSSTVPKSPRLVEYEHQTPTTSELLARPFSKSPLNPFKKPTKAPPRERNDEHSGSSWWQDGKWLAVAFSSDLTTDDRVLLPPLKERPPIYCYRDTSVERPKDEHEAEDELFLTWKRAWWAHGFRPTVLGATEATINPAFDEVQRLKLDGVLRADVMRWLAWDTVGGGLLAENTMLPMASNGDPLLAELRRGKYAELTSWKGLGSGLLAGSGEEVKSAIRAVLELSEARSVLAALPGDIVKTDATPMSLAYYGPQTIASKYAIIGEATRLNRADGLRALNRLINAHLHVVWQNSFSHGIDVLQPYPNHTSKMVSEAIGLAESLLHCPETPLPASCPPNLPRCAPCTTDMRSTRIATPSSYHNASKAFTIGFVPHPWTLTTLNMLKDTFDLNVLRRDSLRDPWLLEVTDRLLDDTHAVYDELPASGDRRIMRFKEAIASEEAESRTLFLTAEAPLPSDLDWRFGFSIPQHAHIPQEQPPDREDPSEDPTLEWILLERAKQVVFETAETEDTGMRTALETWNMADYEAWKFTRALQARRVMERSKWASESK